MIRVYTVLDLTQVIRASRIAAEKRADMTDYVSGVVLDCRQKGSYAQPNRNISLDAQPEKIFAVRGITGLVTFTDSGDVEEIYTLTVTPIPNKAPAICAEIPTRQWHTLLALSDDAITCQVRPNHIAREYAKWTPKEEDASAARRYLRELELLFYEN